MGVTKQDMEELRRIAVNSYGDEDKACMKRVIRGISSILSENAHLKAELERLKVVSKSVATK